MSKNQPSVLCVDDEPMVLSGLTQTLRKSYQVVTAASGRAGLEALEKRGPFAVVLSDMRMPEMDGATFLARARLLAPDTVRMLLTGYSDTQSAIAAVNEGQIFRFLTKPCPPEELHRNFLAATEQYRFLTTQRVQLEQTIRGSIKTLTDILSLANPVAFGRAKRISRYAGELIDNLKLPDRWQVEVAAMLSQLAALAIPEETAKKQRNGEAMSPGEQALLGRLPRVAEGLFANVPRLESAREILGLYPLPFGSDGKVGPGDGFLPMGARVLRIAIDFEDLESRGVLGPQALEAMGERRGCYDPEILQAFARLRNSGAGGDVQTVHEVRGEENPEGDEAFPIDLTEFENPTSGGTSFEAESAEEVSWLALMLEERSQLDSGAMPAFSAAAARIIELTDGKAPPIAELIEVIRQDASVSAQVFRAASSAHGSNDVEACTLRDAAVRLGAQGMSNIAIAAARRSLFDDKEYQLRAHFLGRWSDFWRTSVQSAVAARWLSLALHRGDAEQAYFAGLVHDIGKLLVLRAAGALVNEGDMRVDINPRVLDAAIEATHVDAGSRLVSAWGLPGYIRNICNRHHEERPSGGAENDLLHIVRLGSCLVEARVNPFCRASLEAELVWSAKCLGLEQETLRGLATDLGRLGRAPARA